MAAKVTPIPMENHRPLFKIAEDIRADWKKVYFGAVPYLEALENLDSILGMFGADSADDMVRYFLSNASTWRGAKAREIKDELRGMLPLDSSIHRL
jgi:hypothetical protein